MKKSVYLIMLMTLSPVLVTGCDTLKQPTHEAAHVEKREVLHERECVKGAPFHVLEKSNVTDAEGEKSFVIASEFQANPVLLSVGGTHYQTMEVGKSYYITFEGMLLLPDIEMSLIETTVDPLALQVQSVKEVQPQGLENKQQPLTCN